MKYAIEFTLNEELRNHIFHYWEDLFRKGFTSPQTESRPYEPHISLLVFDNYSNSLLENIESIDYSDFNNSISFHSFGIFKHEYSVLFLNPRTEFNWLEIHQQHYSALKDHSKNIWDFYTPSKWNPHCSLVADKSYDKILEVLKSLEHFTFPIQGIIEEISLVNFKEGKTIYSRKIK